MSHDEISERPCNLSRRSDYFFLDNASDHNYLQIRDNCNMVPLYVPVGKVEEGTTNTLSFGVLTDCYLNRLSVRSFILIFFLHYFECCDKELTSALILVHIS